MVPNHARLASCLVMYSQTERLIMSHLYYVYDYDATGRQYLGSVYVSNATANALTFMGYLVFPA